MAYDPEFSKRYKSLELPLTAINECLLRMLLKPSLVLLGSTLHLDPGLKTPGCSALIFQTALNLFSPEMQCMPAFCTELLNHC
eukprot:862989-Amphidinium_carterae.1